MAHVAAVAGVAGVAAVAAVDLRNLTKLFTIILQDNNFLNISINVLGWSMTHYNLDTDGPTATIVSFHRSLISNFAKTPHNYNFTIKIAKSIFR